MMKVLAKLIEDEEDRSSSKSEVSIGTLKQIQQ